MILISSANRKTKSDSLFLASPKKIKHKICSIYPNQSIFFKKKNFTKSRVPKHIKIEKNIINKKLETHKSQQMD
jgi:hypothetical protein